MAVCWVILRGQQIYTVIQAEHTLLYIVAKGHFFSVETWKDIIKYLQKCEGCTHSCEILYIHMNSGINNIIAFLFKCVSCWQNYYNYIIIKKLMHILCFSTILKGKLMMFMSLNKMHSSKYINISEDETKMTLIIVYIDTLNQTNKKDHMTIHFIVDKIEIKFVLI